MFIAFVIYHCFPLETCNHLNLSKYVYGNRVADCETATRIRSCLPNFNCQLWLHVPFRFSEKIILVLGFDLWSANNQQRELTTSPMTLIVEQVKGNTVFDMFLPLIC